MHTDFKKQQQQQQQKHKIVNFREHNEFEFL